MSRKPSSEILSPAITEIQKHFKSMLFLALEKRLESLGLTEYSKYPPRAPVSHLGCKQLQGLMWKSRFRITSMFPLEGQAHGLSIL